jgi:hypothetical protein
MQISPYAVKASLIEITEVTTIVSYERKIRSN